MLVEFRVRNFRSLRDEQVLSLVASKDKALLEENTIQTGLHAAPRVVRSAVLYGPNAGGKSNLIRALHFMGAMVTQSAALQAGQPLNFAPFALSDETRAQPGTFEVTFVRDGVRYQYGFGLTAQRITHEYLLVYKAFKPQQWFRRTLDAETGQEQFEFGPGLQGPKSTWKESTKANSLFLSTAVQLNSEQLRPVFEWFQQELVIFDLTTPWHIGPQFSINMIKEPAGRRQVCDFLNAADISIADIELVGGITPGPRLVRNLSTGQMDTFNFEEQLPEVLFLHSTEAGQALMQLADESMGTQRLFALTGPVLTILARGQTLVVDELDTSLHPLLVRRLVRLFQSSKTNPKGAQLLFSTHDSTLLDQALFRRDQIWFVEKSPDQSSKLYPLTEFSPRKNEALEAGYLAGRYGALPFFREWPE